MDSQRYGFEIVFLLGGTFRHLIDQLHRDLAAQGYPEARPIHGFALQAIGPHGITISDLGRQLGVSKQAAAKTAKSLESAGYVTRHPGPADARVVLLRRTARAEAMTTLSARFFERQVREWQEMLGVERFEVMIEALATIGEGTRIGDLPGWLGQ
jgi:DNA-binding MarR family transcriptional regulator